MNSSEIQNTVLIAAWQRISMRVYKHLRRYNPSVQEGVIRVSVRGEQYEIAVITYTKKNNDGLIVATELWTEVNKNGHEILRVRYDNNIDAIIHCVSVLVR